MGLLTFKGGIHPDDGKRFSKDQPIRPVVPQGELVYPLSQHIGAPAKPVVKKGDCVLKGQLIAEAGGFVSSPIYSSVSGKVKGLEQRFNPTGSQVECIVVENDGEYKEVEYEPVKPLEEMTREEIINKIGDAGIVGMGGAGFPTKVKLSPKEPDKIEYIIANCAECEPYITADYRRMLEYTEDLVSGMKVILSLFPNARGVFAVEDNKKDCIEKLQKAVAGEPRIDVKALMTKYPQGAERQLIYAVTKRPVRLGLLRFRAVCLRPDGRFPAALLRCSGDCGSRGWQPRRRAAGRHHRQCAACRDLCRQRHGHQLPAERHPLRSHRMGVPQQLQHPSNLLKL